MIKKNALTYASAQEPWYMWEPKAGLLHPFLVAVMITLITSQASGLVFDVLLTLRKAPKRSMASNLGILILTWKLSPLAILNSIYESNWIQRTYYGVNIPCPRNTSHHNEKVSARILLVLFAVLACGPLLDTFFITLTLERTRTLSFAEAGFHPIGFGIEEENNIVETIPLSSHCKQVQVEGRELDRIIPKLIMCTREPAKFTESSESVEVGVFKSGHGLAVGISFLGHWMVTDGAMYIRFPDRSFPEDTYAMSVNVMDTAASSVVEKVLGFIIPGCGRHKVVESSEVLQDLLPAEFQKVAMKSFQCENHKSFDINVGRERSEAGLNYMLKHLTIVESNDFRVGQRQKHDEGFRWITYGPEFVSGIKLPFVQRREMNISLIPLLLVLSVTVLLRLILIPFASNDLFSGVVYIVKDELGLGLSESLLTDRDVKLNFRDNVETVTSSVCLTPKEFREPGDPEHLPLPMKHLDAQKICKVHL